MFNPVLLFFLSCKTMGSDNSTLCKVQPICNQCVLSCPPLFFLMNMDPDDVLFISLFDADAKVLIEMQAEDLRQKSSPGQANQMGPVQPLPFKTALFKIILTFILTSCWYIY